MRNIRHKILYYITTVVFLLTLSATITHAQEIKISDILPLDDEKSVENTTEKANTSELNLEIPAQTDNPSQVIKFTNPSKEKKPVSLSIDDKASKEIDNPYTLPALSIGSHTLKFTFTDSLGTAQEEERKIVVIPRVPTINVPKIDGNSVVLTGTGLADAEIFLITSADGKTEIASGTTDADGKWSLTLDNKLVDGVHTFTAYIRKYGYASNLADVVKADLSVNTGTITTVEEEPVQETHFAFADITVDNWKSILKNNTDILILCGGVFVLGILITLLLSNISRQTRESREVKQAEQNMVTPQQTVLPSMTLFDKLSKEVNLPVIPKIHTVATPAPAKRGRKPKVEKKQEEDSTLDTKPVEDFFNTGDKIVTRIDFLRDYKDFDPDDEQGKEKDIKNDKISINVTSKK